MTASEKKPTRRQCWKKCAFWGYWSGFDILIRLFFVLSHLPSIQIMITFSINFCIVFFLFFFDFFRWHVMQTTKENRCTRSENSTTKRMPYLKKSFPAERLYIHRASTWVPFFTIAACFPAAQLLMTP